MRDTDWRIIDELYKNQNITKVANLLYMTQPTLTKRLQAIEEELDTRLVNRSTKGVQFTREGEYVAHQAELYLQFLGGVRRRLKEFREEGYGTIRIASSITFEKLCMPELIREFSKHYPNISFDIQTSKSHNLTGLVKEGSADLAFIRGDYPCDMNRVRILTEAAYLISAKPITLEDLEIMPRIQCIMGEATRKMMDRWWEEKFDEIPRVSVTVRQVDNSWEMVRQGLGYTISFCDSEHLDKLGVCYQPMFFEDGSPMERDTWLVYPDRSTESPMIHAFIEEVIAYFCSGNE